MKHFIALTLSIILLLSCPITIFANENTEENLDSVNISSDEIEKFQNSSLDTVIKLYNGSFMKCFYEKQGISNIIEKANEALYMVKSPFGEGNGVTIKKWHDEKVNTLISSKGLSGWSDFGNYATSPTKVFDVSTIVHNVYCLSGESSNDGVYIYYVTNKGDYVLYKEYLSADETYLFTIEEFYDVAKVVYENRLKNKHSDGGGTPINELLDMKPYVFRGKSIFLQITIPVALCATGIAAFIVIKKRKNKKTA